MMCGRLAKLIMVHPKYGPETYEASDDPDNPALRIPEVYMSGNALAHHIRR